MEVLTENLDVKVKFMHPKLSTPSLKWPSRDYLCWVPNVHVCRLSMHPLLLLPRFCWVGVLNLLPNFQKGGGLTEP